MGESRMNSIGLQRYGGRWFGGGAAAAIAAAVVA